MLNLQENIQTQITECLRTDLQSYVFEEKEDIEERERELRLLKSPGEIFDNLITFYEEGASNNSSSKKLSIAMRGWSALDTLFDKVIDELDEKAYKLAHEEDDQGEAEVPKDDATVRNQMSKLASAMRSAARDSDISRVLSTAKDTLKSVKRWGKYTETAPSADAAGIIRNISTVCQSLQSGCSKMASLEKKILEETGATDKEFREIRSTITRIIQLL